ncbi:exo-alpha-sialidase [Spirosoma sp.]|uniref:WD40/YVTN/BNR-like repeat-containing protein n=1 Tax=Spirosoma sp. TaxID=1899569 RepID=UPI002618E2F8|nr:exo-alpha-sialidase [Spirosoma sp.]MCX6215451.1 exo-alpha-sialidase [Spirosoma sp.]
MDISSKYFSKLQQPGFYSLKHGYAFLLDIYRVGKVMEAISFVLWELMHQLRFFQLNRRYVKFTQTVGSLEATETDLLGGLIPIRLGVDSQKITCQLVTVDWKYCFWDSDSILWGCRFSSLTVLYRSDDGSQSATAVYDFQQPIKSIFINRCNVLFVCTTGALYKSHDYGVSFRQVLQLSTSISYFLFNNGMSELPDQTLVLGEYGSLWREKTWKNLAFLYISTDGGNTWKTSDFLIQQGVNKHVHLLKYSKLLKALVLTDGDNKKQLWMNKSLTCLDRKSNQITDGWHLINKYHHQMGGYTSMAETEKEVLLGSDYLAGTNFIVSTADGKQFDKRVLPDPYRRSPVMNMITRKSASGNEVWASSYSCLSAQARSLLMYSKDGGKSWTRVIEFDGTRHKVRLISTSHEPTTDLYISVTEFGDQEEQHRHQIYKITEKH